MVIISILRILSYFFKSSEKLKKLNCIAHSTFCQIMEMLVIDIVFAGYFNLITDYK